MLDKKQGEMHGNIHAHRAFYYLAMALHYESVIGQKDTGSFWPILKHSVEIFGALFKEFLKKILLYLYKGGDFLLFEYVGKENGVWDALLILHYSSIQLW